MLNVEEDGPVLRITLNRPDVRNALNEDLIRALTEAFRAAATARVVVLAGAGSAFCAGGDLGWMQRTSTYTPEENRADALRLAEMFQAIVECPAAVIARVHGPAFGGGVGLVAAADVAIAGTDAKFSFSEVKIGLAPATISFLVIPKIGPGHARALFTTGQVFGPSRAKEIGLVHEAVPTAELDATVELRVAELLKCAPAAVAAAKRIALGSLMSMEAGAGLLAELRASDEGKEGVAAFLEKRPAAYVIER